MQGLRWLTRETIKPLSYEPSFTGKLYSQTATQLTMKYTPTRGQSHCNGYVSI
jgi:hypothetical protein